MVQWTCPSCRITVKLDDCEFPFTCPKCKNQAKNKSVTGIPKQRISKNIPQNGPGTKLHEILKEIGIVPTPTCSCHNYMLQMNIWGVDGCREHFCVIVGWLQEGSKEWHWRAKMKYTLQALTTSLVFVCDPLNPYPGLVEEAIRRTEKEKENAPNPHVLSDHNHCERRQDSDF